MLKVIVIAVIALAGFSPSAYATTSPEVQRIRDDVRQAYLAEDFERLDGMIEEYQHNNAKTESGTLKVAQVYGTLSDYEELFGAINHEALGKADQLAQKWLNKRPKSRAARIMIADAILARALYARGDGYINTVDRQQLEAFGKLLRQSEAYLRSVKGNVADDPQWYVLMMRIQMNVTDQESFMYYANEALEKFPHYYPIHWMITRKVQPKWGGSAKWANYWLDRIGEADSLEAYARAYWFLFDDTYPKVIDADWTKLKPGFEEIVTKYPTNWNLNAYAFFACMSQDKKTLHGLLDRIGTEIDEEAWKYKEVTDYCREFAYAAEPAQQEAALANWYLVEAYDRRESGGALDIVLGPVDQPTEQAAMSMAEELAKKHEGVQAYKLIPHPTRREYQRPIVLFRHGTIPTRFEQGGD